MKKSLLLIASMILTLSAFGQVAYLQYRVVPADKEGEFVERETKYWSQVAKAAIAQGNLAGWSLWRKVGVTEEGAPNYVFMNVYESADKMDPSKVWTDENVQKMGVDPSTVETNSFTTVAFDYYMQLEDALGGDNKFAIVNYAKPSNREVFIEENKNLWKPLHAGNIKNGNNGMVSWGLMSTIYPTGVNARFSCLTWDGFNTLADALKYMSYSSPSQGQANSEWDNVISKSKMNDIMPNGFQYRIIYELVMILNSETN